MFKYVNMVFLLILGVCELFLGAKYLLFRREKRKAKAFFEAIRTVFGSMICFGAIKVLGVDFISAQLYCLLGLMGWIIIHIVGIAFAETYLSVKNYKLFCVVLYCFLVISLLLVARFLYSEIYETPDDILNSVFGACVALIYLIPFLFAQWELFFGMRYLLFEKNQRNLKVAFSWICVSLGGVLCCLEIEMLVGVIHNPDTILLLTFISIPFHIANIFACRKA